MKRSKRISLLLTPILSTILLSACGDPESTRDVYQSREECGQDWGMELCDRMEENDERQYHQSHGVYYPVYYGPRYYPSDRTVIYQGREISPKTKTGTLKPMSVTSRSSSASRGGVTTPRSSSVTTGGFGSRGTSYGG